MVSKGIKFEDGNRAVARGIKISFFSPCLIKKRSSKGKDMV